VTDEDPGLPAARLNPMASMPGPVAESGRGLHIIAGIADELEVHSRRPRGTLLRFVKRLSLTQDQPNSMAKPRPR
jgi:anti-sigma regulatory factor (Ser/Thr protein kinase)